MAGIGLVLASIWRLRNGAPNKLALFAIIISVLFCGLFLAQLMPLPSSFLARFRAADFLLTALSSTETLPQWGMLSLSPNGTVADLVYCIVPIGLFLGALTLAQKERSTLAIAIIGAAIVSAILGLAQRAGQGSSFLQLFEDSRGQGFFANRNFQGALLYCTIPFLAALSFSQIEKMGKRPVVLVFNSLALLIVILIGIGATASRSATILAMVAVIASTFLLWRRDISATKANHSGTKLVVLVFIVLITAQATLLGISRIADTDLLGEGRAVIYSTSYQLLKDALPLGTGFGTFVPLYAMREQPDNILGGFVNHAHNDWMEIILEGGIPTIAILAIFAVWFVMVFVSLWRERAKGIEALSARAATIIILLLFVHSISDYPLRNHANLALFALCLGILAVGAKANSRISPNKTRNKVSDHPRFEPTDQQNIQPVTDRKPYFGPKVAPQDKIEH